ncbi:MAG: DNA-formamidopyrimidine glycosylase family protein [Nitrososphaerales archaeon]
MPESVEVRRTCALLRARCKGRTLLQIIVHPGHKHSETLIRDLKSHEQDFPLKLIEVLTIGKQMWFFFDSFILNSGMGMTGHWVWKEMSHTKLEFKFGHWLNEDTYCVEDVLFFDEVRPFSHCFVMTHEEAKKKMNEIGYDVLNMIGEPWPVAEERIPQPICTYELFRPLVKGKAQLCSWLLRQDLISGIGNYLKSEILYVARLSPLRTLDSLSEEDILRLYQAIIDVVRVVYQQGGYTFGDYITPDGEKGQYVSLVYQRKFDPEGRPVIRQEIGGRGTFWVPEYQN